MTGWPKRAWRWLLDLIDDVESRPWGPGTLVLFVAGLIAVRNLIEIIVPRNPVFESLAAFVHYPMAYVAPFLALTLVLALWGGVAPIRVARLMALAWLLTLLPPLADFVVHHEAEKPTIGYLTVHHSEVWRVWLRFFDPSLTLKGTTTGIRIETLAAVLLGALYVFIKSKRWYRALGAAATVYVTSLFFFSLPLLVTLFFRLFDRALTRDGFLYGQAVVFRPDRATSGDSAGVLWLTVVLVGLGAAWRFASRRHGSEEPSSADRGPAWTGVAPFYAAALWAGCNAAIWLHMPAGQALVYAPFDGLAFAGAGLAIVLLVSGLARSGSGGVAYGLAGLGLAACTALGRGPALGIAAAAGALAPFALGVVPERPWRRPLFALALAVGTLGAFGAGYCLVVGPEGLARMPHALAAFVAIVGAGLGWVVAGAESSRGWLGIPVLGFTFGVAVFAFGDLRVAVVAVPAGLVAGLVGWGVLQRGSRPRARLAWGVAAGLAVFALVRGTLATDFVREPLAQAARCIPRLDVLRGEALRDTGDWASAEGFFRRALECDATHVPALRALGLGIPKFRPNALARGIEYLETAVRYAPDSATELGNLAAAYLQAQRPREALELLERAVALAPDDLTVLANRAQALEDVGRFADAERAWSAYLAAAAAWPEEAETIRAAKQHLRALRSGTVRTPPPAEVPQP